jgi:hypothetical protein
MAHQFILIGPLSSPQLLSHANPLIAKKGFPSSRSKTSRALAPYQRQHALGFPYRYGGLLQSAPVDRPQRIPSQQRRSSMAERSPSDGVLAGGDGGEPRPRWCFVSLRHAVRHLPFLLVIPSVIIC